jgi:hypothetical protein
MKNCTNKNGLPMKGVDMNLFHGGQYEYNYSHIGMGCHNLVGLPPENCTIAN